METGVYHIVNTVNGRVYVGVTWSSFRVRWATHRRHLNEGRHINSALQHDWLLYGADAFRFEKAIEMSPTVFHDYLDDPERAEIARQVARGVNIYNNKPRRGLTPWKHSDEREDNYSGDE